MMAPISPQNVLYFLTEEHLRCRKSWRIYVYYILKYYHSIKRQDMKRIKDF